jgi:hypothetical protein
MHGSKSASFRGNRANRRELSVYSSLAAVPEPEIAPPRLGMMIFQNGSRGARGEQHSRYHVGPEQGVNATTPRIPPASSTPAVPSSAGAHGTSTAAGPGPARVAPGRDRSGTWLRIAASGLCMLAAAAATVSFTAQYRMVYATRRLATVAGLEAAIPDAAALVFASLGVALALHGRHAIRARALNVASVGTSVFMNVIAASPGWRSLAIWDDRGSRVVLAVALEEGFMNRLAGLAASAILVVIGEIAIAVTASSVAFPKEYPYLIPVAAFIVTVILAVISDSRRDQKSKPIRKILARYRVLPDEKIHVLQGASEPCCRSPLAWRQYCCHRIWCNAVSWRTN